MGGKSSRPYGSPGELLVARSGFALRSGGSLEFRDPAARLGRLPHRRRKQGSDSAYRDLEGPAQSSAAQVDPFPYALVTETCPNREKARLGHFAANAGIAQDIRPTPKNLEFLSLASLAKAPDARRRWVSVGPLLGENSERIRTVSLWISRGRHRGAGQGCLVTSVKKLNCFRAL